MAPRSGHAGAPAHSVPLSCARGRPRPADEPQPAPDGPGKGKPNGHGRKSEAARQRAILALIASRSLAEAAKEAGIGHRTLRRWLAEDEDFKRGLTEARRTAFQQGMQRIQGLTNRAVDTLAELMGKGVPPTVRLGAARTVADLAAQAFDREAILQRLDTLEEAQHARDGTLSRRT